MLVYGPADAPQGAETFYNYVIKPFLSQHEATIDTNLTKLARATDVKEAGARAAAMLTGEEKVHGQ